jgi:AraC-like DNA-binding protein
MSTIVRLFDRFSGAGYDQVCLMESPFGSVILFLVMTRHALSGVISEMGSIVDIHRDYGVSYARSPIEEMLSDFHLLTGIRVAFVTHDMRHAVSVPADMAPFCRLLRKDPDAQDSCLACDQAAFSAAGTTGSLQLYTCHAGLIEAVAPILDNGRLLGFLMMGQTTGDVPSQKMWQAVAVKCKPFKVNHSELESSFYNLTALPIAKIEASARLLARQASLILQSGWVQPHGMPVMERLDAHVMANMQENLQTSRLSRVLGLSASRLTHVVKEQTGESVTRHVRLLRLSKAKDLLEHTNLSIGQIAVRTGWPDLHYFTRLFRKSFGMTPSQYRQSVFSNSTLMAAGIDDQSE